MDQSKGAAKGDRPATTATVRGGIAIDLRGDGHRAVALRREHPARRELVPLHERGD
jgi:hypothetical protein